MRLKTYWSTVSAVALLLTLPAAAFAEAGTEPSAQEGQEVQPATNGWGIAVNDLTPDPAVRYGTLPNGMRYALRRNEASQGTASVRLTIDAGRLAEMADERGLAHFLEHMAFRGSKAIPDGELLKKLERLGLAFGADTNAETAPDYTRYKLDLPRTDDAMIDAALMIMRQTASELTLGEESTKQESGVILAEAPTRDSPLIRNAQEYFRKAAPDSKLGDSFMTDDQTDVRNADAATLRRFYERNYRPEKATLVIVGDIDIDATEKKLTAKFSDWVGKGAAGGNDRGRIDAMQPLRFGSFAEPNNNETIELARLLPHRPATNTIAEWRDSGLDVLWQIALSKRLGSKAREADAPFVAGSAMAVPIFRTAKQQSIAIMIKDGDWQSGLSVAEQEVRRVIQHGFSASEIEDAFKAINGFLQNAAQTEQGRTNDALATALSDASLDGSIVSMPSKDLELLTALQGAMTADAVNAAFRKAWGPGANYVHLATKAPVADFAAAAQDVLTKSRQVAVAAPAELAPVKFAYENFGKAGRVQKDATIADLGIRTVTFKNGVMLNIKKTDFEPGKVHFTVRIGSGLAAQKDMIAGLPTFLNVMSPQDGLAAHSYDELQRVIGGRQVKLGLSARMRDIASAGSVAASDLALQMQLVAATVTAFGYRAETDQSWQALAPSTEDELNSGPMGIFTSKVPSIQASDDPRIANQNIEGLSERNMAELQAWLQPELEKGPIEVTLVGDVDEAVAIDLVAKTLGALPKRGKAKPAIPVAFPKDLTPRVLMHKGKDDQGMFLLSWPSDDDSDLRSTATRDLLAGVLQNEMREILRSKLGATYTPEAVSIPTNAFPGYGTFLTLVTTPPENMDLVKDELLKIVAQLRAAPVSDDALLRVRQPILERFAAQERQNSSWMSAISEAQSRPERLDRRRNRQEAWASITPADIQKAAQQYLTDQSALEIRIISEASTAAQKN
ncbi:MAG: hypothetical protein RL481_1871 [Pseudomonadota bacterium]